MSGASKPWVAAVALLAFAACPIEPNNFGDAGPDGGIEDAGTVGDGGAVDAGTPASGTVSCLIGASTGGQSAQLAGSWGGADLAGTAAGLAANGEELQIQAENGSSGTLTLLFEGLVAGSTAGALAAASYQPPAGFLVTDGWACSGDCSFNVVNFFFDGTHVSGAFQGTFFAAQSTSGGSTCSLTQGSFAVTLPQ